MDTEIAVPPCPHFNLASCQEAIDTLRFYNIDPFATAFAACYGLQQPDSGQAVKEMVADKLTDIRTCPKCRDVVGYLDELKMWGRQHVFLFSLDEEYQHWLEELSQPEYVRGLLREHGLEDRYNRGICVWCSQKPFLSEVNHVRTETGKGIRLAFKWTETRTYRELRNMAYVARTERTANSFIINLFDGTAQLRIQLRRPNTEGTLESFYETYIREATKTLGEFPFRLATLEPIMRQFLMKSILTINYWKVKSATGYLEGNTNPSIMRKLTLQLQSLKPRVIRTGWECQQESGNGQVLHFGLDAGNNSIVFAAVCDRSRMEFILHQLHHARYVDLEFDRIRMRQLRELARVNPDQCTLILAIDYYFRKLKKGGVHSGRLAATAGFAEDDIKRVFQLAVRASRKKFVLQAEGSHLVLLLRSFVSKPRNKHLRELVSKYPELVTEIAVIDHYFERMNHRELHSGQLALETGLGNDSIRAVFKIASEGYPFRFELEDIGEYSLLARKSHIWDGLLDKLIKSLGEAEEARKWLVASVISALGISASGLALFLTSLLIDWLIRMGVEILAGPASSVIEALVEALILTGLFGVKRIRRWAVDVPGAHAKELAQHLWGAGSSIAINEKQYKKWWETIGAATEMRAVR